LSLVHGKAVDIFTTARAHSVRCSFLSVSNNYPLEEPTMNWIKQHPAQLSLAAVSFGVIAATTLLAGCGPDGSGPAAGGSPSPTPTPKEALLAAVPDGTEGAFRFTGKDSSSDISGVVDPASLSSSSPEHDGIRSVVEKVRARPRSQRDRMRWIVSDPLVGF
jgi:hypothetical protein